MHPVTTRDEWHTILAALHTRYSTTVHLLQSWDWGALKSRYGWTAQRYVWYDDASAAALQPAAMPQPVAAAQVLRRAQPLLGRVLAPAMLYVPKGPVFDWHAAGLRARVLDDLQALARGERHDQRALFIKLDPDVLLATGKPNTPDDHPSPAGSDWQTDLTQRGWRYSDDQVQFRNTVLLDLRRPEDDILAAMKQKTRYNIRLADRKGVAVRRGTPADFSLLADMYAMTASRDSFVIRPAAYYKDVWGSLMQAGLCQPLIAEVDGEPVAAVVLTRFGGRAYYMYGMSTTRYRQLMPNYALQWAAIRWAKTQGCHSYDMWGAPEVFDESDSLWGVWRFKSGFNGTLVRTLGAWDYPASALGYRLFTMVRPRLLTVLNRLLSG